MYTRTAEYREKRRLEAASRRATPEGKVAHELAKAKHKLTQKYKATQAAYLKSPEYKVAHAAAKVKYLAVNRDRINRDRRPIARIYSASTKAKVIRARYMATPLAKKLYTQAYLKRTYGLTLQAFEALSIQQGGVCAICGKPNRADRRLVVDHDHKTGKVRALLCDPCNLVLGYMDDNVARLQLAIDYVLKHRKVEERIAASDYQI